MDIRIIGDTIEIGGRTVATIASDVYADGREVLAEAIERGAQPEPYKSYATRADFEEAQEATYNSAFDDAERQYAAIVKAARVLCTSPVGFEDLKQALAGLDE